jgi:membrane protease YdiL (CAAX protease family)
MEGMDMFILKKGKLYKSGEKACILILVFFSTYLICYICSVVAGKTLDNFRLNSLGILDNSILGLINNSVRHIVMLIIPLLILMIFFKKSPSQIGFNLKNKEKWFKYIKWFCIVITIIISLFIMGQEFLTKSGFIPINTSFYDTTKDRIANILFAFIMPAIGEEPLFRAFVIIILLKSFKGSLKIRSIKIPIAVIISPMFFMIAHTNINFIPFSISNINIAQQLLALVSGLFLAWVYYVTESLVPCMIIHNFIDVIYYALGYIIPFIHVNL